MKRPRQADAPLPLAHLFIVRWASSPAAPSSAWGDAGSSASATYADSLVEAISRRLDDRVGVQTVLVASTEDVRALTDRIYSGDLVLGSVLEAGPQFSSASREDQQHQQHRPTFGLYFLWPTCFSNFDGACLPDGYDGYVEEDAYFSLLKTVEGRGVPTRFPHPSHVHRLLASKQWQAHLSTAPRFALPATTLVPVAAVTSNPHLAADRALNAIRTMGGGNSGDSGLCGVVKLGFSWEANDVRKFDDKEGLVLALQELVGQEGCFVDSVLVQRFVPNHCELRVFVVAQQVRFRYFCSYLSTNNEGKFLGWAMHSNRGAAAAEWCEGDTSRLARAEAEAETIALRWAAWLGTAACCELQPAIRVDFLVVANPDDGGPWVRTLELTEMGFSMLGWEEGPAVVFGAIADALASEVGAERSQPSSSHPA